MRKRILAGLLSLAMILMQMPVSTYADILPALNTQANEESTQNNDSKQESEDVTGVSPQTASAVTFKNDGYPYGKDMTSNSVTLVIEAEGSNLSYQWQYADSKVGTYNNIDAAQSSTYNPSEIVSGRWYRCLVSGEASQAVELVYPGKDGRTWTSYQTSWYVSNGTMAYMVSGNIFDVTGLYIKNGEEYMLQTSYDHSWQMYSSVQGNPGSMPYSSSGAASLDALRVAFNENDDYDVIFEADLADGQQSFSFGCDTQLGNSSTSGGYSDKAALKAMFKKRKFTQVSMIGSGSIKDAEDDDPAFVIAPVTDNSIFWIGEYSSRQTYSYNIRDSVNSNYQTKVIDGKNVVTSLESIDSGMTMSWLNLASGSSVKFKFGVGSVKDTGALGGNVDYINEKITALDPSITYKVTVDGEEETYTITSNEKGEMALSGNDDNGKAYDFVGKDITIAKASDPDVSTDIEITGRPDSPQKPSDLDNGSSDRPEIVEKIEITEMTTDSVTISPIAGQQYAYSSDGTNWIILNDLYKDGQGNYKVTGLDEGGKVYIRTRILATEDEPASEWSNATELTLKATIIADVNGYSGEYDGEKHTVSVVPANVEAATITYSLTKDGVYTTELPEVKDAGSYELYYRIEKDGYYPLCGSTHILIEPKTLTVKWSATTFKYDGTEKLPSASVEGVLEGESCSISVQLYGYGSSAIKPGQYQAMASVDNSNYTIGYYDRYKLFEIEKADKADMPVVSTTAESVAGKKDGKISGLTTDMEIRKVTSDGSSEYISVTVDMLADDYVFESGTYAVRYKETEYNKASNDTLITVAEGKKYTITLPEDSEQIGYTITSDKSEIGYNENAELTFTLKPGCVRTDGFTITVNGVPVEDLGEGDSFTFSVKDLEQDITISITGVADITAPTGEISLGKTNSWKTFLNAITFKLFFKERQQVKITAEDEGSGIKSVEHYLYTPTKDKNELTISDVEKISNWVEGAEFSIDPSAKYVIYAKLTDNAGNVTYVSSDGIILDDEGPVVTGIADGKSYCKNVEFTAIDDNSEIASVTYKIGSGDVKELNINNNGRYTIPVEDIVEARTAKDITVVVTDKAGNSTTVNIKAAHEYEVVEVVKPTALYKGYTVYSCIHTQDGAACGAEYIDDYVAALGVSGLVPNDKKQLTDIKAGAEDILENTDEPISEQEDKAYYEKLIESIDSMLDDIKKAEELKQVIDDVKIPEITNPTVDDKDKLDEALSKINELLDNENADTPTQSLTDAQKKELESLKESIDKKLDTIKEVSEALNAVKEGTSTEDGVDNILKIEDVQPADNEKIESVLTKLEELKDDYKDNLSTEQKQTVEDYYTEVLDKLKEAAEKDINEKLEAVKKQIEVSISDSAEKEAAISKAEDTAQKELEAIKKYTTKEEVVTGREECKQTIDDITGKTEDFKKAVNDNIEAIFDDKKEEIEALKDLTADMKKEALDELEVAKKSAEEAVSDKKAKNEIPDIMETVNDKFNNIISEYIAKNEEAAKENASKADAAVDKTTEVIGDIKTSAVDEEGIKSQVKEELKKSGIENVDVEVKKFNKTPATLHEKGKITGTVEIISGGTTKLVEIENELPELSTFVNYESVVEEDVPKAYVSVDQNTLMDNILGEDECAKLMNGSNAIITLNIKNKDMVVTDSEAKLISDQLTGNVKVGKYLDINLYLNIVDSNGTPIVNKEKISEANTTFTIKIDVPEELRPTDGVNRTYQIIRVHNGVAEVLDATYDETEHTLTFMTDRFSTYAIAYSDADSQTVEGESTATGDANSMAWWLLLMAAATLGIFTVSKKRRCVK